jgi:hypothetical protein
MSLKRTLVLGSRTSALAVPSVQRLLDLEQTPNDFQTVLTSNRNTSKPRFIWPVR